ncbi:MAG: HAD-IA family hydrolase [Desulfobacterales bacterium]|nr:MAG: HAD-IA family hydrolase [Desulfobacterales bacterium]
MNNIKAVVFDCDGVMFDTEEANRVYYSCILKQFGRPAVSDEQFAFIHMHTVAESINYLFPDEKTREAAHEFRKSMDYRKYLKYLVIEPHLVSLLEKLRPQIKTAVATNRTDTVDRLLAEFNLDGYFDLVVTSSDVERPKPHPDVLHKVLNYFELAPYETIYVGDSQVDELAAKAACIPLIAYRNRDLASEHHIDTLKELEGLLNL